MPEGITKEQLPENVTYAGFVTPVPFEKHQGYLSCSYSECFANSAVEASAKGLVCLLSHTDLAHAYYGRICPNTKTFRSLNELVETLRVFQHKGEYSSSVFAKNYIKETVAEMYRQVLKL